MVEELGAAVVEELGAAVVELASGVADVEVELELALGAAFWSVVVLGEVLDGAAVGFAWLDVWSVVAGVVEVWPVVALGAEGAAVDWLELD